MLAAARLPKRDWKKMRGRLKRLGLWHHARMDYRSPAYVRDFLIPLVTESGPQALLMYTGALTSRATQRFVSSLGNAMKEQGDDDDG